MKMTKRMTEALKLAGAFGSWGIDADDPRCQKYSEDGDSDTWNRLFQAGLAKQWRVADDEFVIRITDAGRAAVMEDRRG